MDLFFWRKNATIDAFAHKAANELFSTVQPEEAREFINGMPRSKRKEYRRIDQNLGKLVLEMQKFIKQESLGIYGKARLQKTFNDRLLELGYDGAVTRKLIEMILLRGIARNPA